MDKEYITVKEFSELVGITPQAAYKSVNLKPFINVVNGQKVIDKAALSELYPEKVVKRCETVVNAASVDNTAANDTADSTVEQPRNNGLTTELLEVFKRQLEEKDKQLAEKDRQIEELHSLLKGQQQLLIRQNTMLIETVEPTAEQEQQETKKKSFFDRFKRR